MSKKIGIIAGNGNLPLETIKNAEEEGYDVFVIAIEGEAERSLYDRAKNIETVRLGQLKKVSAFFKKHVVEDVILVGKITKVNIFKGHVFPDLDMVKLATNIKNWKDDSLLSAICDYFESQELNILDSTRFLKEAIVCEKVYTRTKPTEEQRADIQFGWDLAKEMGRLDIGQTVVVKSKAILAVEAIEGTDAAIERGAQLGGKDTVVVKVSKPNQDMRFDVPVVGLRTLETIISCGVRVLAVEAGKTILLDKEAFIEKANKNRIIFTGV